MRTSRPPRPGAPLLTIAMANAGQEYYSLNDGNYIFRETGMTVRRENSCAVS